MCLDYPDRQQSFITSVIRCRRLRYAGHLVWVPADRDIDNDLYGRAWDAGRRAGLGLNVPATFGGWSCWGLETGR